MLIAPFSRRRAVWPIWSGRELLPRARSHGASRAQPFTNHAGKRGARNDRATGKANKDDDEKPTEKKPSLIEQLFPEETKRDHEAGRRQREIPRLPLEIMPEGGRSRADRVARLAPQSKESMRAVQARREMEVRSQADSQTSVLVLLNASKNLTEEDFRRLIPKGEHLEGWRMEQGDILKVIPGRNLATLEQENYYYLVFSSPMSAFVYQGHATRISRLAAEQTPNSLHTALAPTPGYMLNGIDVYAAIQSYTLTSSTQTLNLRQLRPPLSPLLSSVIGRGGYSALLDRPDRMPYEVRLTLEGPQLPTSRIRYIVYESGRERALGWSGGDESNIKISKYEPAPPTRSTSLRGGGNGPGARARTEDSQLLLDMNKSQVSFRGSEHIEKKYKQANNVYILGFHTEHAAQSFIRYWHRKPMDWGKKSVDSEGDLPPIANVELLW
jgi:hypothetical protein